MEKLYKEILEYKKNNNLTSEQCASKLDLTIEQLEKIDNNEEIELDEKEISRIQKIIDKSKISVGKRIIGFMDLIFRFVPMVMSLVVLLLCINENVDTKNLIVLLSIGLVCSAMTMLPKIEK